MRSPTSNKTVKLSWLTLVGYLNYGKNYRILNPPTHALVKRWLIPLPDLNLAYSRVIQAKHHTLTMLTTELKQDVLGFTVKTDSSTSTPPTTLTTTNRSRDPNRSCTHAIAKAMKPQNVSSSMVIPSGSMNNKGTINLLVSLKEVAVDEEITLVVVVV